MSNRWRLKNWTWTEKIWTEWYQIMIKLKILRLEMYIENTEIEGDEMMVSLVCEPRWIWQKKRSPITDGTE